MSNYFFRLHKILSRKTNHKFNKSSFLILVYLSPGPRTQRFRYD